MKKDIHPENYDCTVTCACGNTFTVKSTKPEINVEICSACHPFYTGKQARASRAGRVDKYLNDDCAVDCKYYILKKIEDDK